MDMINAPTHLQSALAALKDIHLPQSLPWWELALGWWLLIFVLILLVVVGCVFRSSIRGLWQDKQGVKAMRCAIKDELDSIELSYAQEGDAAALLRQLSVFLRRVCLSVFAKQHTAGLVGDAWLFFLDEQWAQSKPDTLFSDVEIAHLLTSEVYQTSWHETNTPHVEKLLEISQLWASHIGKKHA